MRGLKWAALAALAALCACGGGGGGGHGGGNDHDPSIAFTPSPVEVTAYAGESTYFSFNARWTTSYSDALNVAVVDRSGVITNEIEIRSIYESSSRPVAYRTTLQTASHLAVGMHSGEFELRLCRDAAATCANPYPGSPWRVPYRISVKPAEDLRALQPMPGAPGWSTRQGNAARTGSVPVDVSVANITRRFRWTDARHFAPVDEAVTDSGLLIFADRQGGTLNFVLRAVSEATGKTAWQSSAISGTAALASSSGRVHVAIPGPGKLLSFDAKSGQQVWSASFDWGGVIQPPLVHQDKLFAPVKGGVSRLDASTGRLEWTADLSPVSASWSISAEGNQLYAHDGKELVTLRADTGAVVSRVPDVPTSASNLAPPLVDSQGNAFAFRYSNSPAGGIGSGVLTRFDLRRGQRLWSVSSKQFGSPPVLSDGVLYVTNAGTLEARSVATGDLLWSWDSGRVELRWLAVVGRLAFVGGTGTTFAVDLATRAQVWSYPMHGPLTVSSDGVLTIVGTPSVVAFNLR